ncbi:MAG TPA: hypothetical protein VN947_22685 [Polyangia bacterium]|nr:hypothetical protein [Polyangia bacterium]
MRIVAIALVSLAALGGCSHDDTILRITVEAGVDPAPASLQVTLFGAGVDPQPRTIAPATLPGTIVLHGLPDGLTDLCFEIEGFDASGNFLVGGSADVALVRHRTTLADVQMSNAFIRCVGVPPADGGSNDLSISVDAGAPDMVIPVCPVNAIFCDDFESGTLAKWTDVTVKQDAGSVAAQSAIVAHGSYALRALGNGAPSPADVYANAEKDFTPTAPPFALRANVYAPAIVSSFDIVLALYDSTTHGFAVGGDTDGTWVVTEDQTLNSTPDRHSDMVPVTAGQWHCVELVIDGAGMVSLYVDNHLLVGPWARASNVSYSTLFVGAPRSVTPDFTVYIDDVAIGPSRLYCPP